MNIYVVFIFAGILPLVIEIICNLYYCFYAGQIKCPLLTYSTVSKTFTVHFSFGNEYVCYAHVQLEKHSGLTTEVYTESWFYSKFIC